MSTLTLRGVGKRFGAVSALAGIDFSVGSGTRTAIVGPSGSGKTTLLRLIAGFEVPDEGEILLDGNVVANPAASVPAHRRNIGLVMQDGALFPHLSVIDNIRFGMGRRRREGATRALELLDLVELDRAMATRQPHELSGGQQQRVALARALARRPGLMLLDEPFSALDAGLREQMRRATGEILDRAGITTILVTHDQEEAMSFGSQLIVLRGGRLIQSGSPRELYRAPADPVTAGFLGEAIILDALISNGVAQCGLGRIRVNSASDGPATIMLRPDQFVLHQAAREMNGTRVHARIVATDFAGASTRIVLDTGDSRAERASFVLKTAAVVPVATGGTVGIEIVGHAHVFAGSGPSAAAIGSAKPPRN